MLFRSNVIGCIKHEFCCRYLQYIIKRISICEPCCCNTVEMLQTTPSRKLCHSSKLIVRAKNNDRETSITHRFVTLPLAPASSRTLSKRSHKCLPHLPKSSECSVIRKMSILLKRAYNGLMALLSTSKPKFVKLGCA